MRTLGTLTVIAALAAGISSASAQNSTSEKTGMSPSSINKGDLPTKPSGAQHKNPGTATSGSGTMSPAAQTNEKAKSPASMDAGAKQEK